MVKLVGVAGFEPATSCSQSRRDNRATLHPEGIKAESKGFEPLVQFPIRLFSKQVLSAAQATLLHSKNVYRLSGCKCKLTLSILQLKMMFFEKYFHHFFKTTKYQRNNNRLFFV